MFEIEYEIKIGDKTYNQKYPDENDVNNNIFILSGPNDRGKTTTISLLALALTNNNPDKVKNENIKSKLLFLLNKTEFNLNLKLKSHDESIYIEISGNNKNMEYRFKDASMPNLITVGYPKIEDTVDVVFETPGLPEEKIKNTLVDLMHTFNQYKNYCQKYERQLERLIEELTDYNNQESKRHEIENNISKINNQLQVLNNQFELETKKFEEIKDKYAIYRYERARNRLKELTDQKEELMKTKPDLSNYNQEMSDKLNKLSETFSDIKNSLLKLKNILISYKIISEEDYEKIMEASINKIISIEIREAFDSLETNLIILQKQIEKRKEDLSSDWSKYQLLESLIDVLENFIKDDPEIPGLQGQKVSTLLALLIDQKKALKNQNEEYKMLEATEKDIPYLLRKIYEFKKLRNQYIQTDVRKETIEDFYDRNHEKIESQLEQISGQIEKARQELSDAFTDYDKLQNKKLPYPPDIEDLYLSQKEKHDGYIKNIEDLKKEKEVQERLLNDFINIEKPNTNMTLEEINNLYKLAQQVEQKLSEYEDNIKKLIDGNPAQGYDKFYEELEKYLAKVVGTISFMHQERKISQINIRENYYKTDDGEIISFSQMGAGSTALNALKIRLEQLLSQKSNKKYVLLLDEISDIDPANFEKLLDFVKEKTKNDEILLTLMTKPANYENVKCQPVGV
ncbi:MAG: AAA family ATPase [Caldisphaera sp.]